MNILRRFFQRSPAKVEINPAFVKWMSMQCPHTPDIAELEEQQFQLLFACDNLMYACNHYDAIREHSAKLERGFTRHKFNFFHNEDNAIPLLGRKNSRLQPRQIKGELHAVESRVFPRLDNKYQNGVQFRRIRVPILIPYRHYNDVNNGIQDITGKELPPLLRGHKFKVSEEMTCVIRPWMYIGLSNFWNNHLDGGFNNPQVPFFIPENAHPDIPSYYKFPKNAVKKN